MASETSPSMTTPASTISASRGVMPIPGSGSSGSEDRASPPKACGGGRHRIDRELRPRRSSPISVRQGSSPSRSPAHPARHQAEADSAADKSIASTPVEITTPKRVTAERSCIRSSWRWPTPPALGRATSPCLCYQARGTPIRAPRCADMDSDCPGGSGDKDGDLAGLRHRHPPPPALSATLIRDGRRHSAAPDRITEFADARQSRRLAAALSTHARGRPFCGPLDPHPRKAPHLWHRAALFETRRPRRLSPSRTCRSGSRSAPRRRPPTRASAQSCPLSAIPSSFLPSVERRR